MADLIQKTQDIVNRVEDPPADILSLLRFLLQELLRLRLDNQQCRGELNDIKQTLKKLI